MRFLRRKAGPKGEGFFRTLIPTFHFEMMLLSLAKEPQQIWTVTLKWASEKTVRKLFSPLNRAHFFFLALPFIRTTNLLFYNVLYLALFSAAVELL